MMMPWKWLCCLVIIVMIVDNCLGSPMYYKKNENDKYEPDMIAVSSTVIPLSVYEVSYGLGGKPSEEYKQAYMKHIHKKVKIDAEDPDTLITLKRKYHEKKIHEEKANVKST